MAGPDRPDPDRWQAWGSFAHWHEGLAAILGAAAAVRAVYVALQPSLGGTNIWYPALAKARQDVFYSLVVGFALGCGLHARRSATVWIRQLANTTILVVGVLVLITVLAERPTWEDFALFWSKPRQVELLFHSGMP